MSGDDDHTFIGVDVGTGSARAGLFDSKGMLLASAKRPIQTWKPKPDFVQQSSTDIWNAICQCVRQILSRQNSRAVKGIGFDATCSLVVLDENHNPISVDPSGEDPEQNIIVWMDHRAIEEANQINQTSHDVLKYVGGTISPEMETPKLLWLKQHLPQSYKKASHFFDLPDFLTFRATGSTTRSLCSTVCKMTYLGHEDAEYKGSVGRWSRDYFDKIGLADMVEDNFEKVGTNIRPMGEAVGKGLSEQAATELGLEAGVSVGVSIIDAHAGGVGMLGASIQNTTEINFDNRLALIGGTSSCHMAISLKERHIPGIWGGYFSAMVPGFWLNEGGQSATGALVDHIVFHHHQSYALAEEAKKSNLSPYEWLNQRLEQMVLEREVPYLSMLIKDLHVYPDFHGNRSPRADPTLKGMVSGLTLSSSLDDLALLYLATIDAIAHGTRHIIDEMNKTGYEIDTIICCGGGTKNPVFLKEHADITGCRLVLPQEEEAVLLGSAMLGAVAAGKYDTIPLAMKGMSRAGRTIEPNRKTRSFHDKKYRIFHELHEAQMKIRTIMN